MTTKLCEDCIHFRMSWMERIFFGRQAAIRWAKCVGIDQNQNRKGMSLVTRSPVKKDMPFCSTERDPAFDVINPCGSTGKLFQRKGEPAPAIPPDAPKAAMKDIHVLPFRVVPYSSRKEDLN